MAVTMSEESHLKRVVGLPGERLVFTDGMLLVDGDGLREPYLRGLPPYLGLESCRIFACGTAVFRHGRQPRPQH